MRLLASSSSLVRAFESKYLAPHSPRPRQIGNFRNLLTDKSNIEIELLVIKVPMPVRIFIGAYIGYSAGDSAVQLVKSKAGVQFLALAAALATTTGPFQGSLALEVMLENFASGKTLLPTSRQLKDLLAVLEHRLVASRFADVVVYCRNLLSELPPDPEDGHNFWKVATYYPDLDGMAKLVDTFRQLNSVVRSK